jgi:hypothetical protein
MNNYRVLILAAATLLMTFCLVPSIKAQSTSNSMMHESETMTHNKSMGQDTSMGQNTSTMSNPTDNGDRMEKTGGDTIEHMKSGHMMGSHMTETGHGSMSDGGPTGQMSH